MKTLTPVYNTEKYIKRCFDSILIDNIIDDIEIIAINDGSKDSSLEIINKYKSLHPNTLIVIDKENGGHGSTINKALAYASGKYFRVLDSDDWFNTKDFIMLINRLKKCDVDAVITNYTKEHIYNGVSEAITWKNLNEDTIYDFDKIDINILNKEYFVMANTIYKTSILKKSGLKLLEKTFYVDMQYNVIPIKYIKDFVYFDLNIYRYFIGRPDQSMNLKNFIKNRENHEKVVKNLIEYYNSNSKQLSSNKKQYITQILFYMLTTHYYIYCVYPEKGSKGMYKEIKNFDKYLKEMNNNLYTMLNQISHIRYNRKLRFLFVKINPHFFSRLINAIGRLLK